MLNAHVMLSVHACLQHSHGQQPGNLLETSRALIADEGPAFCTSASVRGRLLCRVPASPLSDSLAEVLGCCGRSSFLASSFAGRSFRPDTRVASSSFYGQAAHVCCSQQSKP